MQQQKSSTWNSGGPAPVVATLLPLYLKGQGSPYLTGLTDQLPSEVTPPHMPMLYCILIPTLSQTPLLHNRG